MKQRYRNITEELCYKAVLDCFSKKWRRRDVSMVIEKYAGIPRRELVQELDEGKSFLKVEAAIAIAYEMINRLNRLVAGEEKPLDLDPILFSKHTDGINGKVRDVAYCCVFHQLFNHLAFLALEPLLHARILPSQYASIPNRGQTHLKNHLRKIFRKKSLNIKAVQKTDIRKAYPSTKYSVIIDLITKEIPTATLLIALLKELAKMSPTGCLVIGGFLEAWLFNYLMSYAMSYALNLRKERRGKPVPFIKGVVSFMDDFVFCASREANLGVTIKKVENKIGVEMHLGLKVGKKTTLMSFKQERERRKQIKHSLRACTGVDVGGYVVHHGYITLRKAIFIRARRCFMRALAQIEETKRLCVQLAYRVVAYFGYLKQSNSEHVRQELKADYVQSIARQTISYHQKSINKRGKYVENRTKHTNLNGRN